MAEGLNNRRELTMKNYTITVNGTAYQVTVEEGTGVSAPAAAPVPVAAPAAASIPAAPVPAAPAPSPVPAPTPVGNAGDIEVIASVPGKVVGIEVKQGQQVNSGDAVVILEAMKMEIPVVTADSGTVASINVTVGQSIEAGQILVTLN